MNEPANESSNEPESAPDPTASPKKSDWVIETTDATFDIDVLERSKLGLVLLDFWAEWCAPCRMLGPVLEKLAEEYGGKFTLVKADTEVNQESAAKFSVTGIPAVFGLLDGEVVNTFQGVMPEQGLRDWLQSSLAVSSLVEAKMLIDSDPKLAETKLTKLVADSPQESAAKILLAELLLKQQRHAECGELIEQLEERGFLEPAAEKTKAALHLATLQSAGGSHADLDDLRARAEAEPENFAAQLAFAEALAGQADYQAAFEICLRLVSEDRKQTGEKARELMVEVFRVLPEGSELTSEYRRKLSMVLY